MDNKLQAVSALRLVRTQSSGAAASRCKTLHGPAKNPSSRSELGVSIPEVEEEAIKKNARKFKAGSFCLRCSQSRVRWPPKNSLRMRRAS